MPLKFWDEAFLTAAYLINILPSRVINYSTPTELLLREKPDYKSLRIFGCACWPNLQPYNTRKLAFRSTRCVFLGYSSLHKGFKCLEPSTGRVYISHDVVFDENVFPFSELHPNVGARLRQEILLLPHHLVNPGDASPESGVTNLHPGSSAPFVLQDSTKKLEQNKTSHTYDNGVFVQHSAAGSRSQEDSPAAPAPAAEPGSERSQGDLPPHRPSPSAPTTPAAARAAPNPPPPRAPTPPAPPRGGDSSAPSRAPDEVDPAGPAGSSAVGGSSTAAHEPGAAPCVPESDTPPAPVSSPETQRPKTCLQSGIVKPK
jgi:hypothetical protein